MTGLNEPIAGRLEEAARLLRDQGADPYRVTAYMRAAMQTELRARISATGIRRVISHVLCERLRCRRSGGGRGTRDRAAIHNHHEPPRDVTVRITRYGQSPSSAR